MSFDFLTEHQIHILQRIAAAVLFLGFILLLAFFGKRHQTQRKNSTAEKSGERMEILPSRGRRGKAKKRKTRR